MGHVGWDAKYINLCLGYETGCDVMGPDMTWDIQAEMPHALCSWARRQGSLFTLHRWRGGVCCNRTGWDTTKKLFGFNHKGHRTISCCEIRKYRDYWNMSPNLKNRNQNKNSASRRLSQIFLRPVRSQIFAFTRVWTMNSQRRNQWRLFVSCLSQHFCASHTLLSVPWQGFIDDILKAHASPSASTSSCRSSWVCKCLWTVHMGLLETGARAYMCALLVWSQEIHLLQVHFPVQPLLLLSHAFFAGQSEESTSQLPVAPLAPLNLCKK